MGKARRKLGEDVQRFVCTNVWFLDILVFIIACWFLLTKVFPGPSKTDVVAIASAKSRAEVLIDLSKGNNHYGIFRGIEFEDDNWSAALVETGDQFGAHIERFRVRPERAKKFFQYAKVGEEVDFMKDDEPFPNGTEETDYCYLY